MAMQTNADKYIEDGCGRCSFYATPQCKVRAWVPELTRLRQLLLRAGLTETIKWGVPCYTWKGKNLALLTALKQHFCLIFFDGAYLDDPFGLLLKPGKNSVRDRIMKFLTLAEIVNQEDKIMDYLTRAMVMREQVVKPVVSKDPLDINKNCRRHLMQTRCCRMPFFRLHLAGSGGICSIFLSPGSQLPAPDASWPVAMR